MNTDTPLVMVVEDDQATRDLYQSFLSHSGIPFIEATDGLQALQIFQSTPCPVVITGLYMPRFNGFQLTQELRKLKPDVYVIMVTATPIPEYEREAYRNGVNEFIAKPFDFHDLIAHIRLVCPLPSTTPPAHSRVPIALPKKPKGTDWLKWVFHKDEE